MSFHMHLRAVQESTIEGSDHARLVDFMAAAWDWDVRRAEHSSGVAYSIEKDFASVNDLCAAGAALPEGFDGAWELPVFGGRVFHDPASPEAPFAVLDPAGTVCAAAFLTAVPFDTLWDVAGAKLRDGFGPGWDADEIKGTYAGYHTGLRIFYERAAASGHAVVKAFWY
ncbi:DUF1877 family protein [Streptomyces xantholiticus]|uniref:DUF1877 family protein n=1 Tax=Streptomyces xantholiticus TaxID=68285 RepID=UPI00167315BB|nr:DUF1877 family protein [Streptomyces xantholiticus]